MACTVIRDEKGEWAGIVCSRGRRTPKPCAAPGCSREGAFLCDFPLAKGGTCSRSFCLQHGEHVAHGKDWCRPHLRWWAGVAGMLGIPS